MKFKNQLSKGFLVIIFTFLGILVSQAQVSFKPGIRTGANFAHFTNGDNYGYYDTNYNPGDVLLNDDFSSKTEFYIGFYGAIKLAKVYTLQPEIDYSAQGSKYSFNGGSKDLNVDYLSFGVMNKFTFAKINIHLGPTLDFVVSKNFNTEASVDMAFVLGTGFDITPNFGIEARVKKGIIPVLDSNYDSHTNVVFSLGGTYTFDVK